MGWFRTKMVEPGVHVTEEPFVDPMFRANFYTVRGRDADLQLDFGVGVATLRPALPLTGKPVIAVASHAHVDHVGGFHEFAERWGPQVEASVFDDMAEAGTLQGVFRDWPAALTAEPVPGFRLTDWRLRPAPLTHVLRDGDRLDLGDRQFTVLVLPGHSPGSLALLDQRDGLFLSGDAIYDDELVDDIPGASVSGYRQTMARLMGIDLRLGLGGHGPAYSPARMREIAARYLAATGGASSSR